MTPQCRNNDHIDIKTLNLKGHVRQRSSFTTCMIGLIHQIKFTLIAIKTGGGGGIGQYISYFDVKITNFACENNRK